MSDEVIKTGYIGEYEGEVVYCNEKDSDRGKFLFKCCRGCEHNPEDVK